MQKWMSIGKITDAATQQDYFLSGQGGCSGRANRPFGECTQIAFTFSPLGILC
jgi:hypothetical protein